MKVITSAVLTAAFAVIAWIQPVAAQNANGPSPVEAFFCNFQEGKTMKDLQQVAGRFSKWADKNDPDYSAWILTPRFAQFAVNPQVIWLGSNPNGNSMGKALDKWIASGNETQEEFNSVMRCGGHGLASSMEINAPDGPPGDGVVMFTQCNIDEGSDWKKAADAHKKYSAAMRSLGAKNSNWMFFPMLGGAEDRDFDYWGVSTFNSWSDYFAAYELYVTGGGWKKGMEIMKGIASCEVGTPTVWDVKLVRQGAS
jgi:hypothetical protein